MLSSSGIFCCGSDKLLDLNKALVSYQSAKGSDRTRWCSIHLTIYIKYEEICKSTRGHLTRYNGGQTSRTLNCRPQPCYLIRYWVTLLSSALIRLMHSVHGAELLLLAAEHSEHSCTILHSLDSVLPWCAKAGGCCCLGTLINTLLNSEGQIIQIL